MRYIPVYLAIMLASFAAQAQDPDPIECLPNNSIWLELLDRMWVDQMPFFRGTVGEAPADTASTLEKLQAPRIDLVLQKDTGDWWLVARGTIESCIPYSGVRWIQVPTPEPTS